MQKIYMKANDKQELKPVYIHEASYSTNNEISLVDLAIILVRRKKMIAVIIIIAIAFGVTSALLKPRTYTINTTVEIGSQFHAGTTTNLESPETLLAKLNYGYVPQILNSYRASNPSDTSIYEIIVDVPTGSEIVILKMEGTEKKNELMKTLLLNTTEMIIQDHFKIYERIKQNFITSIAQANSEITSINSEKNASEEKIQLLKNRIESYNSQLANLQNSRVIAPPTSSLEPTGGSRKPVVIVTAFAGVFLAIFAAFFAEFIATVREKNQP